LKRTRPRQRFYFYCWTVFYDGGMEVSRGYLSFGLTEILDHENPLELPVERSVMFRLHGNLDGLFNSHCSTFVGKYVKVRLTQ
jgi:hypothetical protein